MGDIMSPWKQYLNTLRHCYEINRIFSSAESTELKIMKITEDFQKIYPGNYRLDWKVNTQTWTMELHPFFENEKYANWWHLKYD